MAICIKKLKQGGYKPIIPSSRIISFLFPAVYNVSFSRRKGLLSLLHERKEECFISYASPIPSFTGRTKHPLSRLNSATGSNQILRLQYLSSKTHCFLLVFAFVTANTHLKWTTVTYGIVYGQSRPLSLCSALSNVKGSFFFPLTPPSPSLLVY